MVAPIDPARLLDHINEAHGTHFHLKSRFEMGEQGAYTIVDDDGTQAVLKWHPGAGAVERYDHIRTVTDLLRSTGYPAPHYLHIGTDGSTSYSIQTALPGELPEELSPAHVARLIELNRSQQDRAFTANAGWQSNLAHSVLHGYDTYCVIQSLREFSAESSTLLDELQAIVSRWNGTPFRAGDIVHFDFHHRNILTGGDVVTGVVDWDGLASGDCAFDLVTLLFYSYNNAVARDALWNELLSRVSLDTGLSYFAHMIVRQVDWTIRFYDPATAEHFLALGRRILTDATDNYSSSAC